MNALEIFAVAAIGSLASCTNGPKIDLPPGSEQAPATDVAPAIAATKTSTTPQTVYRSHFAMGTQITITAYTLDEAGAQSGFEEAFREFERLEGLLTIWRETSDVAKLNAAAGVSEVVVSPETFEALSRAKQGSELTLGKFDVTFGALSGLWKFDHDQDNSIPPKLEIAKRIALVDYRRLKLNPEKRSAYLETKGMKVHLGGIGKGFAVDYAVAILKKKGIRDFMVQAGGDLYVAGRHGNRAWRVGIRDPRGPPDKYFAATEVTDATFSTSGDYERFFITKGKRYHHIIDPTTGQPATECRSVTIMAKDATTAEYLSKGVFILGPEKAFPILEKIEGAGALVVDKHNKLHISKRLEGKIKMLFPPTDEP